MEAAAGHALEQDGVALAEALQQETEGNPFFVGEVLLHLVESGALVQRDGRWASDFQLGDVGLPEGVKEVIGRRLSRLPESANEVLTVAAVIGRDFDLSLLGAVHEGGQEAVLEALEPAETAGLVRPTGDRVGRYTFDHALLRSTLYDELSTSRRLRLHRDVGRALEGRGDPDEHLPELARHFAECAALGEVDRAVDYGRRAAARATADLAYEEAAAHLDRALGALDLAEQPDASLRCDLLLAQGEAWFYANDPRHRSTLFAAADAARSLGDVDRLASAAIRLSFRVIGRRGMEIDITPEIALLDEVLERLPPEDSGIRARALIAQAVNEARPGADQERRHVLADEALAMARRVGDPDVLRDVLAEHWVNWFDTSRLGWLDESLAEQDELIDLATGHDDSLLCHGLLIRSVAHLTRGDRVEADADLAAAQVLVERLREPAMTWWSMYEHAAVDLLRGRFAEAEPAIAATAAYGQEHGLEGIVTMAAQYYRLRFDQGRLPEFEDAIVGLVADQPEVIVWRTALAAIYTETDRPELARPHVEFVGGDDFARVATGQNWLLTLAATGAVAAQTGQLDIAERGYERSLPFAGQLCWTGQTYERPVDLHLARMAWALGRFDEAEAHCAACIDLCERADAPPFVAHTKDTWAGILIARGGDADRARQLAVRGPGHRPGARHGPPRRDRHPPPRRPRLRPRTGARFRGQGREIGRQNDRSARVAAVPGDEAVDEGGVVGDLDGGGEGRGEVLHALGHVLAGLLEGLHPALGGQADLHRRQRQLEHGRVPVGGLAGGGGQVPGVDAELVAPHDQGRRAGQRGPGQLDHPLEGGVVGPGLADLDAGLVPGRDPAVVGHALDDLGDREGALAPARRCAPAGPRRADGRPGPARRTRCTASAPRTGRRRCRRARSGRWRGPARRRRGDRGRSGSRCWSWSDPRTPSGQILTGSRMAR